MLKPKILNSTKQKEIPEESKQSDNHLMINLLPQDIILKRKQHSKFALISKISIAVLVVLVFLTSTTLALRFSQALKLKETEQGLVVAEGKINSMTDKEGQLIALKKRLDSISSILGGDSKRKSIFNMVVYLIPPDIQVLELSVDKSGNMIISLNSSSLLSIQTLFSDLGEKEKNSDLISKVNLEGLSMGRNAVYTFSLKITPK
ncbi:MAG: hypothetical protein Q7R97_02795 [Candidatus Daviesbacteria bacterium]|nr:hypothetical protein [Candidatus Daviesbacteria bacterium]